MAEGIVVSNFLQELSQKIDAAISPDVEVTKLKAGTKREMGVLLAMIQQILFVTEDAETKQESNEAIRVWIKDLMDAAHITDCVLHNLSKEKHLMQVFHCMPFPSLNGLVMRKKTRSIVKRFEKISAKQKALGLEKKFITTSPSQVDLQSSEIVVGDKSGGQWLEELRGLGELRGELRISALRKVVSAEQAIQAQLTKQKYLEALELQWGWDDVWDWKPRSLDDEVLEVLQPHPDLKKLIIREYCGTKLPSWIQNENSLMVLENLTIISCIRLESFPKDGLRPLVSLKSITLESCNRLTWLPTENNGSCFPSSLVDLKIKECPGISIDSFFVGLQNLTSLASLHIEGPTIPPVEDHLNLTSLPGEILRHLRMLKELEIHNFPKLVILGFQALPSLQRLKIYACGNLQSPSSFHDCVSPPLKHLEIEHCNLGFLSVELLQNLKSLQKLFIDRCSSHHTLPDGLTCLTSLEELTIVDCNHLKSLSDKSFPSSLMILVISGRHWFPADFEEGGPEWHKIAHIPYVKINRTEIKTDIW